MSCPKYNIAIVIVIAVLNVAVFPATKLKAQEINEVKSHFKHSISISLAHSHIRQGLENGKETWLNEPSFMLDYNYHLNERWFIGIHSDIIIQSFEVIRSTDQTTLTRSYPVCAVAIFGIKASEHFAFLVGGGLELEENEYLGVLRLGFEPSFHISKRWEVPISLTYDIKINGYSSLAVGIGFSLNI